MKQVVLGMAALFLVAGILWGIRGSFRSNPEDHRSKTTPTEYPFPTDTVPSETLSSTPVPAEIGPIDPVSKLDRGDLTVSVKNGSGQFGAGSTMAETLRTFGYHVVSVTSADRFDFAGITLFVKPSRKQFLPVLQRDLGNVYSISSLSATLSASSSADAEIIVGRE